MLDKHKRTLDEIVSRSGDCLTAELCNNCPFRIDCLPEFLNRKSVPSKRERLERAADALARSEIMQDD